MKRVKQLHKNATGAALVAELEDPDYVLIAAMAARGFREKDVARRLGIADKTWLRIRQEDPRALEAFEAGRAELHEELISKLLEKAREGQVACLLFALKIMFGYRENQPLPQEHLHRIKIELPAAMDREAYERLTRNERIEAETVDVEAEP